MSGNEERLLDSGFIGGLEVCERKREVKKDDRVLAYACVRIQMLCTKSGKAQRWADFESELCEELKMLNMLT